MRRTEWGMRHRQATPRTALECRDSTAAGDPSWRFGPRTVPRLVDRDGLGVGDERPDRVEVGPVGDVHPEDHRRGDDRPLRLRKNTRKFNTNAKKDTRVQYECDKIPASSIRMRNQTRKFNTKCEKRPCKFNTNAKTPPQVQYKCDGKKLPGII